MYVCRGCGIPGPTYEKEQVVHLDDGTRGAIEEGLAQAERGEFVSDDEVAKADARRGI